MEQSKGAVKSGTPKQPLYIELALNIQHIRYTFGNSSDLVSREILVGEEKNWRVGVMYMDGLVDKAVVHDFILHSLLVDGSARFDEQGMESAERVFQLMYTSILASGEITAANTFQDVFHSISSGNTVVFIDGHPQTIVVGTPGWQGRAVEEPQVQTVIRGPREGFTETIRTNTALIRRKIKDPNLRCEMKAIGRITRTDVAVMYIQGIANEKIVKEVHTRLDRIDVDAILESGYIEEYIQDEYLTPFPTIYNTERPDVIAGGLMEGRIAILVDGTPFVLMVPVLFGQFFQSAEDYYQRADIATLLRILRYVSFFIGLLGPSFYIAVTTFHQEMLPTQLLISLAAQREGVPFPAFVEAVAMEVAFEILREAGIRMPRPMGQAISIVGALVIGQATVEAGFVSAAMVIVVSITAISTFVLPAYNVAIPIRMLRFLFMMLAASFGLFGVTMGLLMLVLHLCSLRSFGVPYMAPFSPFQLAGQKDMFIRAPLWALKKRPTPLTKNETRIATDGPPQPDEAN